jgi:predicted dehydrogenase
LPEVEVRAVFDRDLKRAQAAAAKARIGRSFDNIEQFFDQGLDVVSICTPPWTHRDLAVTAMEHGCHVFTEKPMAMSVAECDEMIAASKRTGRSLCVSHNFLFSRSMIKADELVRAGQVGEIQQVLGFQLSSPRRRLPTWYHDLPGGLFFDEAPHLVYLIRHFSGDPQVQFATTRHSEVDQGAIASLQASLAGSVADASLTMSFTAPVSEWLLVVVGSKMVLMLDIFRDILVSTGSDGSHSSREILMNSLRIGAEFGAGFVTSGALYSANKLLYGHDVLIARFIQAVIANKPPPITGDQGAGVIATMQEILGAACKHGPMNKTI